MLLSSASTAARSSAVAAASMRPNLVLNRAAAMRRSALSPAFKAPMNLPSSSSSVVSASMAAAGSLVSNRWLRTTASRPAASSQAGKPTSENVGHMVKNIKEEAGQVASSITSSIAGRSGSGGGKRSGDDMGGAEILEDARKITSEMAKNVPPPALLWGGAGVIPYVTTAAASVYLSRQAWLVSQGIDTHLDLETAQALLLHAQNIQVGFGAVLLSFLGAIHWGFEFSKYGGAVGNRRYVVGLLPVIAAWPTLLLNPSLALVSQWAAFVGVWFIDLQATTAGWAPVWYSTYRFWLTFFVGTSIIATLAGTRYYDTDKIATGRRLSGTKLDAAQKTDSRHQQELQRMNESIKGGPIVQTTVDSDIEAKSQGEDGDSYVKIENLQKQREEEEKRKKAEEEKAKAKDEKAAKQEEKLSDQMEQANSKKA